ncbi:phage/plasmid primase, P4 family [Thermoproteota archaeon]
MNPQQATLIKRLNEVGINLRRFLKVDLNKRAFEKEWQNRLYTPKELQNYNSWGICGGDGLVLIDTDNKEMADILRSVLPPTFESLSPRRKLPHFYFKVNDGEVQNKTLRLPENNMAAGEIRVKNQYLVSAGTKTFHGLYRIIADNPIATLSYEQFIAAVKPYLGKDPSQKLTKEQIKNGVSKGERHNVGIKYANYLIGVQGLEYQTTLIEMQRWNQTCKPPNDESDIKKMVRDAIYYQKNNPRQKTSYQRAEFSSKINFVLLAKDLMGDYIFVVDAETNELFYYNEKEGIYSNRTEQLIKRQIAERLDENFRTQYYTEISEFLTATSKLVGMNTQQYELLPVKNGLLNVLTKELKDFSPAFYLTNKLDITYDPEIKYSKSKNKVFLEQVVSNHEQREQIQELIGHCLIRKIITETSLVCLGKGGNGKSIFLTTIKSFLGAKNISSHTMQQLCYDKFKIAELKGKLANICMDLPQKELTDTGTYKALVSGDSVPINIKHVQGKGDTLDPYTKYLYSANNLPPIKNEEDCYAWYRRFIFTDFNKTFTPENSTPRQELLDKLSTQKEKSALLNWGLEGLERLIKNGDVSHKPDVETIRKEYRKRSSSTLAYFDDKIKVTDNPDNWVFTQNWFRDYVTYCHEKKLRPKTRGQFVNDVEQFLSGVKKARIRPSPKANPLSAWRYVKIVSGVPDVSDSPPLCAEISPIENNSQNPTQTTLLTQIHKTEEYEQQDEEEKLDVNSAFQKHCSDCIIVLGHEWYEHGKLCLCRKCHLNFEAQKKKSESFGE